MNRPALIFFALLTLAAGSAHADGDGRCPEMPKTEWQSPDALKKSLIERGWKVRRIEATRLCYEVYGMDPEGKRVEAFFNPKTFERVEKY